MTAKEEKPISKETEESIIQLQNLQRQLQMVVMQKQRFEADVLQIDSSLIELEKATGKTFRALGGILIEAKAEDLKKELNEGRTNLNLRIDTLKKQEEKLKTREEELRKKIESKLNLAG